MKPTHAVAQAPLVTIDGDRVFTTSLEVAERFGKRHKNVLRAIRNLTSGIDWARENGFPRVAVYQVLNGFTKAKRGRGHQIAVKLGIKSTS